MTHTPALTPTAWWQPVRTPALCGLAFGGIQATSPLALWWLDQATVQALLLALIASVYIGFAVADGRPKVIAVESSVTGAFVLLAAAAGAQPLRRPHTVVAAVLRRRRLARRRGSHHRNHRRSQISSLTTRRANYTPAQITHRSG